MQVAPGGVRITAVLATLGALTAALRPVIGAGLLVVALGTLWFHRDPDRSAPDRGVVAPADGTVRVLREEDGRLRVGTFMNLDDVHVTRSPLPGTVESVVHEPGAHWPAFTKESDRNERVRIALQARPGDDASSDDSEPADAEITLIAGAFARRIHPYVSPGDALDRGERLGHISFGSRVDVLLPPSVGRADLLVDRGDAVRAGETLVATAVDAAE